MLAAVGFVISCTPGTAAPQVGQLTDADVRAFADPIADNLLMSMNTSDYVQYTRDFDTTFKGNLPQVAFETINSRRIETVGKYISKEYWQMSQKTEKVIVAYRAKFGQEQLDVLVTIYFKNIEGKWYIDGTYFDSPLLRKSNC